MATDKQKVLELAALTDCADIPEGCNGVGNVQEPSCGDIMTIYLTVNRREVVVDSGYTLSENACAPVRAAAEVAAKAAKGKPVMAAYTVCKDTIAKEMTDDGVLDKEHLHCAMMAELALKRAVLDYVQNHRKTE